MDEVEYTTILMPTARVVGKSGMTTRNKYDIPSDIEFHRHYKVNWYGSHIDRPSEHYYSRGELSFFRKIASLFGRQYLRDDAPDNRMDVEVCIKNASNEVIKELLDYDDVSEVDTPDSYKF